MEKALGRHDAPRRPGRGIGRQLGGRVDDDNEISSDKIVTIMGDRGYIG